MSHPLTPVTFDQVDPRARGRAHGEIWRSEIHELSAIRADLCLRGSDIGDRDALASLAAGHLQVLTRELPAVAEELLGIAEGADTTSADIVVLNLYAELRGVDGGRRRVGDGPAGDGSTAIYLGGPDGPVLGQTWDTHADAARFVRMIRIAPRDGGGEALCLTLTGCLGLAGLGRDGVAVTTNELASTDARTGVPWPAIVRAMLAEPDARSAYGRLRSLPRSSGRHCMIADGREFYGVETSGELDVLTQSGPKAAHLHTNHCFDPVLRGRENLSRRTTSFDRLNSATTLYLQQRPRDLDGLWRLLGSHDGHPRGICCHGDEIDGDPSTPRTCARLAMALWSGRVRAASGCSRDDRRIDLGIDTFVSKRPDAG